MYYIIDVYFTLYCYYNYIYNDCVGTYWVCPSSTNSQIYQFVTFCFFIIIIIIMMMHESSPINQQHDAIHFHFMTIIHESSSKMHKFAKKNSVIYRGPDQHSSGRSFGIHPMEHGRRFFFPLQVWRSKKPLRETHPNKPLKIAGLPVILGVQDFCKVEAYKLLYVILGGF